jgi:hypothetical protein
LNEAIKTGEVPKREKVLAFLKEWNIPAAAAAAGLLVLIYFIIVMNTDAPPKEASIQETLATVIFNAFTMVGSLFAFFVVLLMKEEARWGEAKDFRLYVAIGALWGAAVSALFLLQAFGLLKLPV